MSYVTLAGWLQSTYQGITVHCIFVFSGRLFCALTVLLHAVVAVFAVAPFSL